LKRPPDWKLKKILQSLGTEVTLHKITETELVADDEFGQTEETEETYTIFAEIQSITLEEMTYLPAGEVQDGDAWGYFLPSYTIDGESYSVAVNDYITFKTFKYLVIRIIDQYMGGETVLRRAHLRRQVGQ